MLLMMMMVVMMMMMPTDARAAALQDAAAAPHVQVHPETSEELEADTQPLVEGDLLLTVDRNAVGRAWPTLDLPFRVHPEISGRTEDILAALEMVSKHTCVTFHLRTTETDHLLFTTGTGCASFVGFIGGEQPVFVGPRCSVGNVAHEILHALGFHHEHTRMDRQQHVTVLPENVLPGKMKNFRQRDGETFGLPYDIASILHYGRAFFSANGQPTIVARKDGEDMGQRDRLTETDVQRVRRLYHCDALIPPEGRENVTPVNDIAGPRNNVTDAPPPAASRQQLRFTSRGRKRAAAAST